MKILFLDFDGVLCNRESISAGYKARTASEQDPYGAHPDCVAALNRILNTTGAYIVISSVWRHGGLSRMRDTLDAWGVVPKRVLSVTPSMRGEDSKERGDEIQAWLDSYTRHEIEAFVILDDDSDMKHLLPKLVQTDFVIGLTEYDATRAISFLTNAVNAPAADWRKGMF